LLPGGLLMGLLGPYVGATWVGYILAGHVVMSVGFAFLFTPLFTVSLSSVKPSLYSHGSAVIGSLQQVGGAAGVALFVALMSTRATTLTARGLAPVDALSGGIRGGFLCGAIISLFAVACVFFVQKPSARPEAGH
jgi:MFS transporter, DHA2 family, lincomycin resistance protein